MKWLIEPAAVALAIIIVIVAIVLFGAFYYRASTQPPVTPTPEVPIVTAATEVPTTVPTTVPETTQPTPEIPTPPPPPTQPRTYAASATPYGDKNKYYNLPYYSTVYNPKGNLPPTIFHQVYEGKFQEEAVVAKVLQAPLIVDFVLTQSQSPTRSFFFLTVRNNETRALLSQDGFFGAYSENRMKRLYFSSPGEYHINMYGGFVTVDLTLRAPT
ncbi:MAG: hypothetical protein LUQ60_01510 [Methanomicrobiales archaeon]|nr:hypothetical protein [Methanomicrobiales archaeon]